jgi:hypothetical protein
MIRSFTFAGADNHAHGVYKAMPLVAGVRWYVPL